MTVTPRGRARALLNGLAVTLCLSGGSALAACPDDAQIKALAETSLAGQPVEPPNGLSLADARCGQERFVKVLMRTLGPPVGYKVGITSPARQAAFGLKGPVWGVLLKNMLRPNGASFPASFGARPVIEPDLLVRVKSDGLEKAETPLEAAQHLSEIIPFIEVPDLRFAESAKPDGGALVAIDVGALSGVIGTPVPVEASQAFVDALATMRVVLQDGSGGEQRGLGAAVMENPLNAAIWLAQELAAEGRRLKRGDLISVGTFLPAPAPLPGRTYTVRYEGLPVAADPVVTARFE